MYGKNRGLWIELLEDRRLMHGATVPSMTGLAEDHATGHEHVATATHADVTGDGLVDFKDIHLTIRQYGMHSPLGDATGDSFVDFRDLIVIANDFGDVPHGDSPAKQQEHLELLKLFPPEEADAIAIRSGAWSDTATWYNGIIPSTTDRVWIPHWYAVEVDVELTAPLNWLRVDGELSFSTTRNTRLILDTLMGSQSSKLSINTSNPDVSTQIVIADSGPIDLNWDTFAISRGVIWHGASEIHGAAKRTWTTILPSQAGDTQIMVESADGWKVGDRLVIGGSTVQRVDYRWAEISQDDDVRIASIDGNRIILDRPLLYEHSAVDRQNPVVINLTRNVVIESANPEIDRRGHVMFMHNAEQSISYAAFNDLGRTDKSQIASDPDGKGGGLENPRGRYSLHFHRTGTESEVVHVTGVAISGSPGWGLVNHDSHVVADSNVSYNVFGAHYVTELGNERGAFTNNVAIRATGSGLRVANTRERRAANDFAHTGEGFWLEGGFVTVSGNVAVSCRSAGFTFFGTDDPIVFEYNTSLFSASSLVIWSNRFPSAHFPLMPPEGTVYSRIANNLLHGTVLMGYSSCLEFEGNTVLSFDNNLSGTGFTHTFINANVRYIDNRVEGFQVGIFMPTEGDNFLSGGYYDNLEVNLQIRNTQQNRFRRIQIEDATFGARALWNVEMSVSNFSYDLRSAYPEGKFQESRKVSDWIPLFAANNTVLGNDSKVWLDGVPLYFEEQGADFEFGARLTRFPDEIRYLADSGDLATGKALNARGLYVGGEPLPDGEQFHLPGVRGILLRS